MSAIACGSFAALVVLRDMNSFQKVLCVMMVTAFLAMELNSISRDHLDQNNERITAEEELKENFRRVLDQNQQEFSDSISQFDAILKNITGGDSYPCVMPESEGALFIKGIPKTDTVPLVLYNQGDYPLTGISVTIGSENDPLKDVHARYFEADCVVPEVTPHEKFPLKQQLYPDYKDGKPVVYLIWTRAQNGVYMERLCLRKGRGIFDAYQIDIWKKELSGDKATLTNLRNDYKWSDDP